MSIKSVMPSNHLILSNPLILLPSLFSNIRVFSNESVLRIRWPKYWSFSFSISPSILPMNIQDSKKKKYSGLISFRIDLHSVLGTLKSLLQHHSLKAFFGTQLSFWSNSHIHMTTGKTIALTRWTFVGKVMSLLFNMLSRLVIAFLPRSKCLLTSWLQSSSVVTLEPQKTKSDSFYCFTIYLPWSDGTRCHDLSFLNVEF